MSCIAALYLNVAVSHSNDDLTPLGIDSYGWEWAIQPPPSSFVHLCAGMIRRFRRPFVIQDRQVREHCRLPSKQG
eukprot:547050-Pyramimonas_sp.AAC.1